MFTGECVYVKDWMSLAASGMFNTSLCGCLFSFCFSCVRLVWIVWISVQGRFCLPATFSPLPRILCLYTALHPSFPPLSTSYFLLSVIFPCRVVPVMHFAVVLSVQPVCGLCYCMHMQFNYWCSPLTASSALYGSLLLSNIPGDIVWWGGWGAESLNVCVFVCATVEIVFSDQRAFVFTFMFVRVHFTVMDC